MQKASIPVPWGNYLSSSKDMAPSFIHHQDFPSLIFFPTLLLCSLWLQSQIPSPIDKQQSGFCYALTASTFAMSKFLKEYILYFYSFLFNVNDTIIVSSYKTSQYLSCRSKYKSERIYRPKDLLYLSLFIIFLNI